MIHMEIFLKIFIHVPCRYPFVGQESYSDVRKTILKLSVELASTAQRDQFAENPHKIIKETVRKHFFM